MHTTTPSGFSQTLFSLHTHWTCYDIRILAMIPRLQNIVRQADSLFLVVCISIVTNFLHDYHYFISLGLSLRGFELAFVAVEASVVIGGERVLHSSMMASARNSGSLYT